MYHNGRYERIFYDILTTHALPAVGADKDTTDWLKKWNVFSWATRTYLKKHGLKNMQPLARGEHSSLIRFLCRDNMRYLQFSDCFIQCINEKSSHIFTPENHVCISPQGEPVVATAEQQREMVEILEFFESYLAAKRIKK
jgi:hypothetical protein